MEITRYNVQDLWDLYEEYKQEHLKEHYSNSLMLFEEYIENYITQCTNCEEYRHTDEMGISELALSDHICIDCMKDGYGA